MHGKRQKPAADPGFFRIDQEPSIVINGRTLTKLESIVTRFAVEYSMDVVRKISEQNVFEQVTVEDVDFLLDHLEAVRKLMRA